MKAIPGDFQQALVVADVDKKKNKECGENDMNLEKKDKFAERCEDQDAIFKKSDQIC